MGWYGTRALSFLKAYDHFCHDIVAQAIRAKLTQRVTASVLPPGESVYNVQ